MKTIQRQTWACISSIVVDSVSHVNVLEQGGDLTGASLRMHGTRLPLFPGRKQ